MQTLLNQLNTVPGVVGSLVCAVEGQLLAHAFPPVFDASALLGASKSLAESAVGLETVTGPLRLLDLRYPSSRVVVRPIAGAHLLFLCSPSLNLQTLAMSASVAAPKLEKLVASRLGANRDAAGPPARLYETVQRINAVVQRKGLDPYKVRGEIALKAGFALGFIDAETPDDAEKLAKLRAAASAVLGERF